eukprot:4339364-Amphidinium_carterae.1
MGAVVLGFLHTSERPRGKHSDYGPMRLNAWASLGSAKWSQWWKEGRVGAALDSSLFKKGPFRAANGCSISVPPSGTRQAVGMLVSLTHSPPCPVQFALQLDCFDI